MRLVYSAMLGSDRHLLAWRAWRQDQAVARPSEGDQRQPTLTIATKNAQVKAAGRTLPAGRPSVVRPINSGSSVPRPADDIRSTPYTFSGGLATDFARREFP